MTESPQKTESALTHQLAAATRLVLLLLAISLPVTSRGTDSYNDVIREHLVLEDSVPLGDDRPDDTTGTRHPSELEAVVGNEILLHSQPPPSAMVLSDLAPIRSSILLWIGAALGLPVIIVLIKLIIGLRKLHSAGLATRSLTDPSLAFLGENPSMMGLFDELRDRLSATPAQLGVETAGTLDSASPSISNGDRRTTTARFFDELQTHIGVIRGLLSESSRAIAEHDRREKLQEMLQLLRQLKALSTPPELHSVWLIITALEGLLMELSINVGEMTSSTTRTATGAMDLMEAFSTRSSTDDSCKEAVIRVLAVDDDPVSRLAISFALKKTFPDLELAADVDDALTRTSQQCYDVIFLDVQMPGMDGFELCTKIHESALNRTTPVVFVTGTNDFSARAQSSLSGGSDLVGKPFLSSEIILKALTFALRRRLQETSPTASAVLGSNRATACLPTPPISLPNATKESSPRKMTDIAAASRFLVSDSGLPASRPFATASPEAQSQPPEDGTMAFLSQAAADFRDLRDQIQSLLTLNEADRQDTLANAYVGIASFAAQTIYTDGHPAKQLSSALQGLLRKLMEDPNNSTPSTRHTLIAALELLNALCCSKLPPGFTTDAPIQTLVADDDPISRRAISVALQMAFTKPASVGSGEAAVALAEERPFDVIFLDVLMPGMDGFATCKQIRKTHFNANTPVVFVTSLKDFEVRAELGEHGGNDFVGKPFLKSELIVKALTFSLRVRLQKLIPETISQQALQRAEANTPSKSHQNHQRTRVRQPAH